MEFYAEQVSAGSAGDYFQVSFEAEPGGDAPTQYLIVQRGFEDEDDGYCYIETHHEAYRGHFRVKRLEFSATRCHLLLDRASNESLCVKYRLTKVEYSTIAKIIAVINGEDDPS